MHRSIVIGALVLAFLMGFAGAWALQEKEGEKVWTPPPPLEDEFLDRLVGEWEWEGTMNVPGVGEVPYHATEKMTWGLNHQFLISEYKAPMGPGQPEFEGLGLTRSKPGTNEYQLWWFDIGGTGDTMNGKLDGSTLVAEGESVRGKGRSTMTINEDGTASYLHEMMVPGAQEWSTFFKVEGKKK